MGFLSKVWKGIKKGFKAIFKPIKKVFKSFGKFMNKIGIVGQIAMMFIPFGQILGPMMKGFAQFGGKFLTGLSKMGSLGNAAATVIGKGVEFAQLAKAGYQTVTKAVTGFFKTTGKWIGSKLGMTKFKGLTWEKAWGDYSAELTKSWDNLGSKAAEFWDTDFKGATEAARLDSIAKTTPSASSLQQSGLNPDDLTQLSPLKDNLQMSPVLDPEVALGSPAQLQGMSAPVADSLGVSTAAPQISNAVGATETAADLMQYGGSPNSSAAALDMPTAFDSSSPNRAEAPKSLLDKTFDVGKNTAKGVGTSMLTQSAMGVIQGEPEMDTSVPFGPRLGAYTPDSFAPIGVPGTEQPMSNYGQFVAQDTSYSNVPAQSQNYLGYSVWEQLMASYNKQQYPTAMG